MDLFRSPTSPKKTATRPSPLVQPWRSLLPMRQTARRLAYTDPERAEQMTVALTGDQPTLEAARFLELLSNEMADGRVALRVFALRGSAPQCVPGTLRLSCRSSQRARDLLNGCESRGPARMPFRGTFTKELPGGALHHGHLVVERGFDLALVSGPLHRASLESWPALNVWHPVHEPAPRGCPLIVGNSTVRDSWAHLTSCAGAGLAVWPSGSLLWIFKVIPGRTFPMTFDAQPEYTEAGA